MYQNKWALITGASAGIGAEFAEAYAKHGCNLVLVARREDRLKSLATELEKQHHIKTHIIAADLSDSSSPQHIYNETEQHNIHIDILVNNAGFGFKVSFLNCDWERLENGIQVMLTSLIHLTYLFIPNMQKNNYGRVLNISSAGAFLPSNREYNLYCGIKRHVYEFSKMISSRASKQGVYVSAICPGFTYTEFHQAADTEKLRASIPNFLWGDAQTVVATAIKQNDRNKTIIIPGWKNKVMTFILRFINF